MGQTIVMVTHDPSTAAHAERIVRLDKGRLIEDTRTRAAATEASR